MLFRAAAAPSASDVFRADIFVKPYGRVGGAHIHAHQDERVAVVAGRIGYSSGADEGVLGPRQAVTFARGKPHLYWNAGDSEAQVILELRPAAGAEALFEWLYRLSRDRRTDEHGVPGALELAVMAQRYGYFTAGAPLALQWPIAKTLSVLARVLGVDTRSTRPGDGAEPGRADRGRRRG
ncbi:MAG: hypothetical protein AUH85_15895 [Chloroflexi bacterium 13_1_40CM_4_68_4]|nr:MAG: hypothetical protein AUH85_15895 [Chloroflexi bacterium 13_1_40CM_4_68_4]